MLLINVLGLIATLALVSGDCDVGPRDVTNFDFPTAVGFYIVARHSSNPFDNSVECLKAHYGCPDGNTSLITLQGVLKSTEEPVTVNGIATNWNSTGCWDEDFGPSLIWTGRYCVLAYEYDSYIAVQLCSSVSNESYVYVAFRCEHPDEETKKDVKEALKKYNIDINKLVNWWPGNCHHAVS